jgi:hypothetical protein
MTGHTPPDSSDAHARPGHLTSRHARRRSSTNRAAPRPAPRAVGDIVDGDPPVPITVWHLPAAPAGGTVSADLVYRLRANYAHRRAPVVDLTIETGVDQLTRTPRSRRAALVITAWPPNRPRPVRESPGASAENAPRETAGESVADHMASCAELLRRGGCLAIVVSPTDIVDQLGTLVTAARDAGLTYLQHIVVAHQLTTGTGISRQRTREAGHPPSGRRPEDRRPSARGHAGRGRVIRHLRVHTDVLILSRPRDARD